MRSPGSFPPGLNEIVIRRSVLEVALSAQQQGHVALALQLVGSRRLTNCSTARGDRARVLLIDMAPSEVTRKGQVLNRGPSGDDTSLRDTVVRVAGGHPGAGRNGKPDARCVTDQGLSPA